MSKDKCILVVGDKITCSSTAKEVVLAAYKNAYQSWKDNHERPGKYPSIWKCIKEPKP